MNDMVESHDKALKESEEKYRVLVLHSREMYHRVKNNMSLISSMLVLQSGYIKEQKCLEIFKDTQDRIKCMTHITDMFYQSKDLEKFEFNEHNIRQFANDLFQSRGVTDNIELILNIEKNSLKIDHVVPFMLIINEMIANSLKHAFPGDRKGEIRISLCPKDENMIELEISDNGVGIPSDMDFRTTDSLGLRIITGLANQLGGQIVLDRSRGTDFKIRFNKGEKCG